MRIRIISATDPAAPDVGLGELIADAGDYPEAQAMAWTGTLAAFNAAFSDITWVLVEDGPTVAAASSMSAVAGPGGSEWAVIFTGTRPAYRGRGLSRVAKQALHQLAARRGASGLTTTNEAGNTGIRALNASLGYRVVGGEVRMVRQVNAR
jgi:GNAT superfamily N-acetyltransferase